jgi:hypothetical protein
MVRKKTIKRLYGHFFSIVALNNSRRATTGKRTKVTDLSTNSGTQMYQSPDLLRRGSHEQRTNAP